MKKVGCLDSPPPPPAARHWRPMLSGELVIWALGTSQISWTKQCGQADGGPWV